MSFSGGSFSLPPLPKDPHYPHDNDGHDHDLENSSPPVRFSNAALEDEHTCGSTKSFGVHASRGSSENTGDAKMSGDISLAGMNALLQRQHLELAQRLDHLINCQEELMRRFDPRGLVFTEDVEHVEPNNKQHGQCHGHAPEKKKLPDTVGMAIDDYMHRVSTMEGENQRRQTLARERSRKNMSRKQSGTGMRIWEVDGCMTKLRHVVKTVEFEAFFAVMILSSSLFVGVQVEYAASLRTNEEPFGFEIVQNIYALIFLTELVLRLVTHGFSVFWKSKEVMWYWLDLLIVASSVMEVAMSVMNTMGPEKAQDDNVSNFSTLRIARIIRVTRLIRVFRIVRIVRFVRALRTLVQSIIYTLRSLVWAMLLLALVIYVFAILFTQTTTDYILAEDYSYDEVLEIYWSNLSASMMTLFKSIAGGLSWTTVTDALTQISWGWTILFLVYIIFAYFAVLNVMTGVFCQSAIESAQRDQDMVVQQQIKQKALYVAQVKRLFKDIDEDSSGSITIAEFEEHLENEQVKALFESLELEPSDAWTLFSLIDTNQTHVIDIEDFVDGFLRLRGGAKSIDIARLSYENKWVRERLSAFMKYMEAQLNVLMSGIFEYEYNPGRQSDWYSSVAGGSAPLNPHRQSAYSHRYTNSMRTTVRSSVPHDRGSVHVHDRASYRFSSGDFEYGHNSRKSASIREVGPRLTTSVRSGIPQQTVEVLHPTTKELKKVDSSEDNVAVSPTVFLSEENKPSSVTALDVTL